MRGVGDEVWMGDLLIAYIFQSPLGLHIVDEGSSITQEIKVGISIVEEVFCKSGLTPNPMRIPWKLQFLVDTEMGVEL